MFAINAKGKADENLVVGWKSGFAFPRFSGSIESGSSAFKKISFNLEKQYAGGQFIRTVLEDRGRMPRFKYVLSDEKILQIN